MTEKYLEQKLVKKVRELGGKAYKFVSPSNSGVPDRLVLLPKGRCCFVEVKKPKQGKLSKLQIYQKQIIERLGFKVFVLDDPCQIEEILNEIKNESQR